MISINTVLAFISAGDCRRFYIPVLLLMSINILSKWAHFCVLRNVKEANNTVNWMRK